MLNTPILLITFNRPDHTRKVLERILDANPKDLYVFQDGAREGNENDVTKCAEVRKAVEELCEQHNQIINHQSAITNAEQGELSFEQCEITNHKSQITNLHRLYSDVNLGCGPGPMTALNWFFSENEMGIILEDDAVPHPDFFGYCEGLLEMYKDDDSVRAIGSMHLDNRTYGDGSYYFSMMNRTFCAWATWARAWKDFDLYHRNVTRKQFNRVLKDYGCALRMREYWCDRLAEVQKDALHGTSWDQQFWMSIWLHHGKGIMPNVNLSTNIGFDATATHGSDPNSAGANRETFPILPLKHPSTNKIWHKADQRFQEIYFEPYNYGWKGFKNAIYRWNKRIKRLIGHEGSWIKKK